MTVYTQKKVLDDVLQWMAHPSYCVDTVTISNGDIALAEGDSLIGQLAFYTGSVWKILDDGDSISATSLICPILHTPKLLEAATADEVGFLTKVPILRRGPALVQYEELVIDAVEATVLAAMLALGIKTVSENGLVYTLASVV